MMPLTDRDHMAERFARLIRYCGRRRTVHLATVARGLDCSTRTVRRYLIALDRAGFDVPRINGDDHAHE